MYLSQQRILAYFQQHAETELVVDQWTISLGAVLLQRKADADGMLQPVEHASRSLTSVKRRYSQTNEGLAVPNLGL